ncbi:MAG: hypothetical protein HY815_32880, partial [Candidatus Riflebacteria bacterium]|nr:hypothetical protein [Candidatus Riflebacteria bacterium]
MSSVPGFLCFRALNKTAGTIVLALALALGPWAGSLFAQNTEGLDQDKELRLTGQYFEFDHEKGSAVIKDGAYIEHLGLKMWADNVHGDMRKSLFFAEGNVVFWRGDEKYSAQALSYNTKTHRGTATDLKTQRGPAIIKAKKLEILNQEYGDVMEVVEPARGLE